MMVEINFYLLCKIKVLANETGLVSEGGKKAKHYSPSNRFILKKGGGDGERTKDSRLSLLLATC